MYSQDGIVPGTNDKVYSQINCHGCGAFGYYLLYCPETEGQQNLNLKNEEPSGEKEVEVIAGGQHVQLVEMMDDVVSSSSDGSYLIDFRDCQFSQSSIPSSKLTRKYAMAVESLKRSEIRKKLSMMKRPKVCFLIRD